MSGLMGCGGAGSFRVGRLDLGNEDLLYGDPGVVAISLLATGLSPLRVGTLSRIPDNLSSVASLQSNLLGHAL